MNLVGKIFVFLIFLMSLVFATFSVIVYSAHTNWRDEVLREEAVGDKPVGWKPQLEYQLQVNQELEAQLAEREDMLAREIAARRRVVAQLETEKERLLAQQGEAQGNYDALLKLHEEKLVALENATADIQRVQGEIDELRQVIKDQQNTIETSFRELTLRTESIHQLEGEVGRLNETNESLVDQVARAKLVLERNGLSVHDPDDENPPALEGRILAVRQRDKDTFVELSVGSDDGLEVGHTLQVFRGDRYLGNVVVVRTRPDRAAGQIDRATRKGPIQVRDRFESRRALERRL